jgi:hypothetical protein
MAGVTHTICIVPNKRQIQSSKSRLDHLPHVGTRTKHCVGALSGQAQRIPKQVTRVHRGAPDQGCGSRTLVDETTAAATASFAKRHILDPTTKPLPVTVTEVPPFDGPLGGCREARTGSPLPSRVSPSTREHSKSCPAILVIIS